MQCSKCGFRNVAKSKKCDMCGQRLRMPKTKEEKMQKSGEKKEVQKSGEKKKVEKSGEKSGWIIELFVSLLEFLLDL